MNSELLIQQLVEQTRQLINRAEQFRDFDNSSKKQRTQPNAWNVLECLEHLNLYGDFYLPQFREKMKRSEHAPASEFRSGWLGAYFSRSMLADKKGKIHAMKTFKDKNPLNAKLDRKTIDRFLNQQMQLLELLNESRYHNLNKVKIPISIAPWLRIKLGDAFLFYMNHMLRHMDQAERAVRK